MSDEPPRRPFAQTLLLFVALTGWLAFGGAFWGMIQAAERSAGAQAETAQLRAETERIMQIASDTLRSNNALIDQLKADLRQAHKRLQQNGLAP